MSPWGPRGPLSDEHRAKVSAANKAAWERRREMAPHRRKLGNPDLRAEASISRRRHGKPHDPLASPCARRDLLRVLADVVEVLALYPTMLPGEAIDMVWQRLTTEWRQEARAQALTQVDHGHEHPTREG